MGFQENDHDKLIKQTIELYKERGDVFMIRIPMTSMYSELLNITDEKIKERIKSDYF